MPTTNPFFSSTTGYSGEQQLLDDLTREQIKMFGIDVAYLPRVMVNYDKLLHESTVSAFETCLNIPMYVKTFDGYDNSMEMLTKFGIRSSDQVTLQMSRSEFETYYSPFLKEYYEANGGLDPLEGTIAGRPKEGDLIHFPMDDSIFEIKYVAVDTPFFQLGQGYIYEIQCERFEYSGEDFNTGIGIAVRVDKFSDSSIDMYVRCFTKSDSWNEWLSVKEKLAIEIKKIVEKNKASFAFPSSSIYIEKKW